MKLTETLNFFEGNLKMPANLLNAASGDWSAEPTSNMRSFPLTYTWLNMADPHLHR